ncbi:MAG: hypothetical protein SWY16_24835 [Cyanobacteriota bacterium]|nr:hypothetical protein [Cyanobacteriota bacterium]
MNVNHSLEITIAPNTIVYSYPNSGTVTLAEENQSLTLKFGPDSLDRLRQLHEQLGNLLDGLTQQKLESLQSQIEEIRRSSISSVNPKLPSFVGEWNRKDNDRSPTDSIPF